MLKRAKVDNALNKEAVSKAPGSVSQRDLDQSQAAEEQAVANLETAKAILETNQLNLHFTKITLGIRQPYSA